MDVKKLNYDKQSLQAFIKFPYSLLGEDRHYAPPIFSQELNRLLNPLCLEQRAQASFYLLYDKQTPIARLASAVYKNLNQKNKQQRAYLFFFDCINNLEAAKKILDYCIAELQTQGIHEFVMCYNTQYSQFGKGILTKNEKEESLAFYPYTPLYYQSLLKEYGFVGHHKQETYQIEAKDFPYEKFMLLTEKAMQRFQYRIEAHRINKANIDKHADRLMNVIHQCYHSDWEIPQPSEFDVKQELQEAIRYSNDHHLILAYAEERIVGAYLHYADPYQRLRTYKGKGLLLSILDAFLNRNTRKNYIAGMVFVVPDYQKKAVDLAMVCKAFSLAQQYDIESLEVFTIPTVNAQYEKAFTSIGGKKIREYSQFILRK